jgi:hypothetical protein
LGVLDGDLPSGVRLRQGACSIPVAYAAAAAPAAKCFGRPKAGAHSPALSLPSRYALRAERAIGAPPILRHPP